MTTVDDALKKTLARLAKSGWCGAYCPFDLGLEKTSDLRKAFLQLAKLGYQVELVPDEDFFTAKWLIQKPDGKTDPVAE